MITFFHRFPLSVINKHLHAYKPQDIHTIRSGDRKLTSATLKPTRVSRKRHSLKEGRPALMSLGFSCSLPVMFIHVTAICVLLHWANKRDDDDDDDETRMTFTG